MKKRISSIIVPICKFIPILLLAYGTFWVFYDFSNAKVSGIIGYLFICIIAYSLTFRWKSVYSDGNNLYVFNYLKQIVIPTSNIASINASSWWSSSPRTLILKLKAPTEFGDEIVFVPKPLGFMATETANQLRKFLLTKD